MTPTLQFTEKETEDEKVHTGLWGGIQFGVSAQVGQIPLRGSLKHSFNTTFNLYVLKLPTLSNGVRILA